MGYQNLQVSRDGASGIITLNRPDKLNAINSHLLKELALAIAELEDDTDVRGIILTGSQRSFSTGADLAEAVTIDTGPKFMVLNRLWRAATYAMEHCRKPVVGAVSGYCLTGGLELALACDIRLASENATFGITSSKIGSVAGAGGTQRLPRLVGPAVAMEMLFTARFLDAAEAAHLGLVNRVVDGDVLAAAKEMVRVFATRGPLSLTWMKMAVQSGLNLDLESSLDLEAVLSASAFASSDKAEGMTAFLEKRDPVFTGA